MVSNINLGEKRACDYCKNTRAGVTENGWTEFVVVNS